MITIDSTPVVRRIFHISDIHIRLYQRMKEYQYCFQKLYDELSSPTYKNETNIIVVTGDIVHSKNELSPECDTMTFDFLSTLASIFPTFIIAGNHDALLNNRNRMDTLSSILHQRSSTNLYFLKYTDVYHYGNLYFHVDSLLDEKEIDMTCPPKEAGIHVALFHGSIKGWKNAKGYTSDTGEKYIQDFKGMDYVLLGDIHMFQYMSKTKPVSAYASSLISQNFGETDIQHGMLIWDLKQENQTFHRIDNPYRYQDVHVMEDYKVSTDGVQSSLEKISLAKWGQIRLYANHDEIYSKKIYLQLQQLHPEANFHFQYKKCLENNKGTELTLSISDDVASIRSYLQEHVPSTYQKDMYEYLVERWHHQEIFSIPIHWEILSISFSNLFGYGPGNSIHFSESQSKNIIGIFGKNSVGKSTIVDVISLLLFDKVTRLSHGQSIPKEVIHVDEKEADGQIILRIGAEKYIIEKNYKRQKNEKIKQVTKFFQISCTNEKLELTGEQRKRTNQFIEQIVGKYDSFIYINSYLQQREQSFRDMTPSLKKKFMNDLYGYNWFSQLEKETKETLKELQIEYRVKQDHYHSLLSQSLSASASLENLENFEKQVSFEHENISKLQHQKDNLLLKIKWTPDSYEKETKDIKEKIYCTDQCCQSLSDSLTEAHSFLSKWKQNFLLQQYDLVSHTSFFQEWHPLQVSKNDWNTFHEKLLEYKNTDILSEILKTRNRLNEKLKNFENKDIQIDTSIIDLYPQTEWETIQTKLSSARENEKNQQDVLKNLYTSLHVPIDSITDPSFLTKEKNRVNVKQSRLEQELKSIQKNLKQFENILPFLQKENTSSFLHSHDEFKSNSLYQNFSPFCNGKQSEWKTEYKQYDTVKTNPTDTLQKEIEDIEQKIERLQQEKMELTRGAPLSSSLFHSYQERILKPIEPMVNLLEHWEESDDKNLVYLQKLENNFYLLRTEIDMLETSIRTFTFVPNPNCEVCLNNQDYQQKISQQKQIQLKQKQKKKIQNSIQQLKTSFSSKFTQLLAMTTCSSDDILSKKFSHEKLYKQNVKFQNDFEEARIGLQKHDEYQNFQEITGEISKWKQKLKEKKEKFSKLYSFLKHSSIYDYIALQWKYLSVFPKTFEKLVDLFSNYTANYKRLQEDSQNIQQQIILEENNWKVFQQQFYNDLKIYRTIQEIEDDRTEIKNMEKWQSEILNLRKKENQQSELNIITELEQKQQHLELLQSNLSTIHYLSILWENPDFWNVNVAKIKDDISYFDKNTNSWENEKYLKEKEKESLTNQLKEINEQWENHQTIFQEISQLETKKESHQTLLSNLEKEFMSEKIKYQSIQDNEKTCKEMEKGLYVLEKKIEKQKILNSILDKDGLPLYLLSKKMNMMECQMNDLLSPFLPGKQIRFFVEQKSIEFGVVSSSNPTTMVNLFGGMESFILELVIKLTFSKYSALPRSNFFIIDEGISVLDQQNISNINSLFQFLSHLVTNVLLISHIPQIQDFVDKSMYITKQNNKSSVQFGKK